MNIQNIASNLMTEFYSDMESEICGCLAAGAPMDKLIITRPEIVIKDNVATMQGSYGFDLSN